MNEEITIIDSNTRNEKIKDFFINNKKIFTVSLSIILILIIGYLSMKEIKEKNKVKLANQFNIAVINFKIDEQETTVNQLTKLISENDSTYSPLALFFLIDNDLIKSKKEINILFDKTINEIKLDKEIKNLIIYKKALFNSELSSENDLLQTLNPIINSDSKWKPHALYLIAEYFYSKNEKQKAKEIYNQILNLKDTNRDIFLKSKIRINRDFSD